MGKLCSSLLVCLCLTAVLPLFAQQRSRDLVVAKPPAKVTEQLPAGAKRYALVIGVDEYQDPRISRLEGAASDAQTLATALIDYAGFPAQQVVLLATNEPTDRHPTRGAILRRLSNLRGTVPADGLLVVAFAGHGIERNNRAYLLPSDAQVSDDIALLEDTAISVDIMRDRITQTGVQQVMLILDACRNDPAAGRSQADNLMTSAYTKFNFDQNNRGITAHATLYATEIGHRAYEYKEKRQGYFTWALVEGLKGAAATPNGTVTLGSLITYLQDAVPTRVKLDLGNSAQQRPFAEVSGYRADNLVISAPKPSAAAVTAAAAPAPVPDAAPPPPGAAPKKPEVAATSGTVITFNVKHKYGIETTEHPGILEIRESDGTLSYHDDPPVNSPEHHFEVSCKDFLSAQPEKLMNDAKQQLLTLKLKSNDYRNSTRDYTLRTDSKSTRDQISQLIGQTCAKSSK